MDKNLWVFYFIIFYFKSLYIETENHTFPKKKKEIHNGTANNLTDPSVHDHTLNTLGTGKHKPS